MDVRTGLAENGPAMARPFSAEVQT